MVNQDLIFEIESRFQRGERKEDIKKDLVKNGWVEKEVDDAIAHLQRLALKEIPVVSSVINFWETFEQKVTTISPRTAIILLSCLALVVCLIGVGLYFIVDPLGSRSGSRDQQRQAAFTQLQTALNTYHLQNSAYPMRLSELVPNFVQSVPRDPGSGREYQYKLLDDGGYELCIPFELKEVLCFSPAKTAQNTQSTAPVLTVPSVSTSSGSTFIIDGLVFTDANNDKIQQKGEPGVSSVVVHVADQDGKEICNKLTDTEGRLACEVSKPGVYYVFLDEKEPFEVLGAHPQRITIPSAENPTEPSVHVVLRTAASSPKKSISPVPTTTLPPTQ